jgi:hypothetical protein
MSDSRLTIQASFAAIRTTGLTPSRAMAMTASCISPSFRCQQIIAATCAIDVIPSMLPCSQSTQIQSTPERAIAREWFVPGSICTESAKQIRSHKWILYLPSAERRTSTLECLEQAACFLEGVHVSYVERRSVVWLQEEEAIGFYSAGSGRRSW